MCGRYSFAQLSLEVEKRFKIHVDGNTYVARYNAAPGQNLAVITNEQPQILNFLVWGLIPFWAKDSYNSGKMINARIETILEKPAFNKIFQTKRCLIPADGFYEWKKIGKQIIPHHIRLKSREMFAFAGLWDEWKNASGKTIQTFSIITTSANEIMKPIHQRMPVILPPEFESAWLNSATQSADLLEFLKPFDDDKMEAITVKPLVNSIENDSSELQVFYPYNTQTSLFDNL